ncbi:MAG: PTS sugar transporter subunit IIA [Pseudomonadota bacterium]
MEISDILLPEAVKVFAGASSKKRMFMELADVAQSVYGLDAASVSTALLEREELGPTGVGSGVALPHARLPEIDGVKGVFVRLERPLDFGAADRQPVDLMFGLFAPAESGVSHLKALALVSRMLRDSSVCMKLRANADPATLHLLLTSHPSTRAA